MKKTYFLILTILAFYSSTFSQETSETFSFDSENRTYLLYVPTTYNAATDELPIVLALHGLGDTKENFNNFNGFKAIAEAEKFILVTPQAEDPTESITVPILGSIAANTVLTNAWHSGAGGNSFNGITIATPYYVSETRDDIGFLSALIDSLSANYGVDSNRIYSTGFSMGGFMTNKLGCELSDKIAAIASVSGTIGNEIINTCNPGTIIPALHIHSIDDQTVAYTNNSWGMDAQENVDFWVANNNCNTVATTTDFTNVVNDGFVSEQRLYTQGDSTSEVEFYHLEGPDHTGSWYTGNADFNTSQKIWEFFSKHEKIRVLGQVEEPNAIQNTENLSFSLYPNPTTGKFTISLDESLTTKSIQVTNTIGELISLIEINKSIDSYSLDISNQAKGMYFIQLEGNNGKKIVSRIFKN